MASQLLPSVTVQTTVSGGIVRKRSSPYRLDDTAAAALCFADVNRRHSVDDLMVLTFDYIGISHSDFLVLRERCQHMCFSSPPVQHHRVFDFIMQAATTCLSFIDAYGDLISLLLWHSASRVASERFQNLSLGNDSATLVAKLGAAKTAYLNAGEFIDRRSEDMIDELRVLVLGRLVTKGFVDYIADHMHLAESEFRVYDIEDKIDALITVISDRTKSVQMPPKVYDFLVNMERWSIYVHYHLHKVYRKALPV